VLEELGLITAQTIADNLQATHDVLATHLVAMGVDAEEVDWDDTALLGRNDSEFELDYLRLCTISDYADDGINHNILIITELKKKLISFPC
jgi:hypothetical protein